MNSDHKLRGTACHDQFRWFAVSSTTTVQSARDLHDLSPISTLLMGRLISAAAMLSWDLKHKSAELTLQVKGDGALKGGMVICSASGTLKGYAYEPQLWLPDAKDNFAVGSALGKGIISIIRSEPGKQSYTGTSELLSGEIAEDIAYYYQQSEQVPTAVNLGVLIDKSAQVRAAGGFIIQQLPFAEAAFAEKIKGNLAQTPNLSDLMDMGFTLEEILKRFVFKDLDWQINQQKTISYACDCSRERFSRALLLLGKAELETLQAGISPVCHFCNKEYTFSAADMQALVSELAIPTTHKEKP